MFSAKALGLKFRMVTGYKGSSRSMMAMEQGEVQFTAPNWLAWSSKVPHWFTGPRDGGKGKPFAVAILQNGFEADPALPKVPMLRDLVSPKDKPVADFLASAGPLGRGLAYPPGVDPEIVAAGKAAYAKMNADKGFVSELRKKKLRLIATSGDEIQRLVVKTMKSSSPADIEIAQNGVWHWIIIFISLRSGGMVTAVFFCNPERVRLKFRSSFVSVRRGRALNPSLVLKLNWELL